MLLYYAVKCKVILRKIEPNKKNMYYCLLVRNYSSDFYDGKSLTLTILRKFYIGKLDNLGLILSFDE